MEHIKEYLEIKKGYEDEGYKFIYLFEIYYLKELNDRYGKRLEKLEDKLDKPEIDPGKMNNFLMVAHVKKNFSENLKGLKFIHTATAEGFSKEKFGFIGLTSNKEKPRETKGRFIEAFKKIITNENMVPDKSVILLNMDWSHLSSAASPATKTDENKGMKIRDKLSKVKGQKVLTDFFSSAKSSKTPYKKDSTAKETLPQCQETMPEPNYKVDVILKDLRGDKVKLLWLPKQHYDLDPAQYVSVILLNQIAYETEGSEVVDIADCTEIINRLPNEIWKIAVGEVKKCEDYYRCNPNISSIKTDVDNETDEDV